MEFDGKMLAYCGLYCTQCSLVVAHDTNSREHVLRTPFESLKQVDLSELACPGCKAEDSLCVNCDIRVCAVQNGMDCCADCEDFPCEKTLAFRNDGKHYHLQAFESLEKIKRVGRENWFNDYKKNLYCHCGERSSWYCACPVHAPE